MNVVTRSGGDDFRWEVFAFRSGSELAAEARPIPRTLAQESFSDLDVGVSASGPIVGEELTFFTAYNPVAVPRYPGGLTRWRLAAIIPAMRRARPFHATAVLLLALSGAMSTGLPSHHHQDAAPADTDVRLVSADHHSHGMQLVEQDERTPSGTPQMVAASVSEIDLPALPVAPVAPVETGALRPTERAPPPGAPRAPPLPA